MGLIRYPIKALLICLIVVFPVLSFASNDEAQMEQTSVCISCHLESGDEAAEPVKLWQKSIHYQMGNSCEGCHGGDPTDENTAMDPDKGFVGVPEPNEVYAFCGKCHVGVKENYLESPHYAASLEGKGPNCITCHHSHDVAKASFDLINQDLCGQCHSYENGQKIKKAFVQSELAIRSTQDDLSYLGRRGMPVKQLEGKLFSLRNSLHQMTHSLDYRKIEEKTQSVLAQIDEMKVEMGQYKETIHKRWWGGVKVGAFLLVMIIVLRQLLKTYEE